MDRIKDIEKIIKLYDQHADDYIGKSEVIQHLKYLLEENKRLRKALGRFTRGNYHLSIVNDMPCKHGAIIPSKCIACQAEALGFDPFSREDGKE